MVLIFLDLLLTFVHLGIVAFNLFGWIPPITRKAHFAGILLTAFSWFVLGIWFGMGYCPVTDWQWRVKEQLGEKNLPSSFIKYYADLLAGADFSPALVNAATAIAFALAALISIYVNFFSKNRRPRT